MSHSVVATFDTTAKADAALANLYNQGFSRDQISLLVSDDARAKHFNIEKKTKAPEGAAAGAAIGGTTGAIAAGLTTAAGVIIPGLGFAAAGPIVAALVGAGAGGAGGTLVGGLAGLGFSEHEAKLVERELSKGNIAIAAETEDRGAATRAKQVFEHAHATNVTRN